MRSFTVKENHTSGYRDPSKQTDTDPVTFFIRITHLWLFLFLFFSDSNYYVKDKCGSESSLKLFISQKNYRVNIQRSKGIRQWPIN